MSGNFEENIHISTYLYCDTNGQEEFQPSLTNVFIVFLKDEE